MARLVNHVVSSESMKFTVFQVKGGSLRIITGYHMHCSSIGFGEMRIESRILCESHHASCPSSPTDKADKGLGGINK